MSQRKWILISSNGKTNCITIVVHFLVNKSWNRSSVIDYFHLTLTNGNLIQMKCQKFSVITLYRLLSKIFGFVILFFRWVLIYPFVADVFNLNLPRVITITAVFSHTKKYCFNYLKCNELQISWICIFVNQKCVAFVMTGLFVEEGFWILQQQHIIHLHMQIETDKEDYFMKLRFFKHAMLITVHIYNRCGWLDINR